MNTFQISALRQLGFSTLLGVIHIVVLRKLKNLAYLSLVRPNLEYAAAAWDPYMAKDIQQLERVQRRAARFVKKDYRHTLLSLVCSTNLVGCPCSNVANTLVWWFSTRCLMTFQPFLWITSRFHHGILEPPIKINLCHCQFVLMLLNIHFFVGPLPCHHSWPNASCEHLAAYLERDVLWSENWQQLSELAPGRTTASSNSVIATTTSRKHVTQIAEGGFHIELGAVHIHVGNRSTINWTWMWNCI